MNEKQDYKEKYEKGKLHTRYLFIIAGILAVIGISIVLGGNSEALGQISMASTVSSIILSSIAIFMSISGENKLNYTQNTLMETSDRLSYITDNIEQANSMFDRAISQKLLKLDEISDRLVKIGQSVDNVEKEILNRTFDVEKDSDVDISKEVLWKIYNNMCKIEVDIVQNAVKLLMEYIVVSCSEKSELDYDGLYNYLSSIIGLENSIVFGLVLGILKVFIELGMASAKTAKYFEEKMVISEEQRNEIRKYL